MRDGLRKSGGTARARPARVATVASVPLERLEPSVPPDSLSDALIRGSGVQRCGTVTQSDCTAPLKRV